LVAELWTMVVAYLKQETLEPIRSLGRYVALGLVAGIFVGLGGILMGLGALRALQTELGVHLGGDWSWAPYLIVVLAFLAAAAVAASRIGRVTRGGGG
jgi:hypothetical protein